MGSWVCISLAAVAGSGIPGVPAVPLYHHSSHLRKDLLCALDQPLILRALRKLKVESRWMKSREKKKEERKEGKLEKATKKRMKDSNKYR